jgi:hypothetical protein
LDGEEDNPEYAADMILEIVKDISKYGVFEQMKDLGITFRPDDLCFTDFLLFKWIRETRKK